MQKLYGSYIVKKKKYATSKKRTEQELKMQSDMLIAFYKKNLVLFIERELGIKLTKWQKYLVKLIQKGVR